MKSEQEASKDTFDLSSVDVVHGANQGAVLDLLHPVKNVPVGITIELLGSDSDKYHAAMNARQNKRLSQARKNGNTALTIEQIEHEAIELAAACTVTWQGMTENGTDLDCTKENAVYVYTKYPWIREQVEAFIASRESFLSH